MRRTSSTLPRASRVLYASPLRRAGLRLSRAFALTEVLIALAMIGLMASGALWALVLINANATVSRLYTGAMMAAQGQIDLILSDTPFDPQLDEYPAAGELNVGTQTQTIPIYTDPNTGNVVVTGTMTTTITDPGMMLNGDDLNTYQATVTVTYQFRNRSYTVTMSTLRASDA